MWSGKITAFSSRKSSLNSQVREQQRATARNEKKKLTINEKASVTERQRLVVGRERMQCSWSKIKEEVVWAK